LEIKVPVNELLSDMKIDSLTVAEWTKLEEMKDLLQPLALHTDLLQTDALSLSYQQSLIWSATYSNSRLLKYSLLQ